MGNGNLDVRPDLIRRSGGGIRTAAQQLRSELTAFQGRLAGFGQPWGNDDVGALIGGCYLAIHDVAMECYEENIAGLETEADGVNTMAGNYYQAEATTAVEVNNVRNILG